MNLYVCKKVKQKGPIKEPFPTDPHKFFSQNGTFINTFQSGCEEGNSTKSGRQSSVNF